MWIYDIIYNEIFNLKSTNKKSKKRELIMNKKLLIIGSSVIGAAVIVSAGSGITYQVKWTHFKKDFADNIASATTSLNNFAIIAGKKPFLSYQLKSTSGHTVRYTITIKNNVLPNLPSMVTQTVNEHYGAFSKFSISGLKGYGKEIFIFQ